MNFEPYIISKLSDIQNKAESNLKDNVLLFWTRNTWDNKHGGFLTRLDRTGRLIDSSEKILMMQIRMIWSLSAAHRFGISDKGYLELADKAFDFTISTMWDHTNGGFYFSVTREGRPKTLRKNTDFHGYALTCLSEYYLASQKKAALEWAEKVLDVLLEKAADGEYGFIEDFDGSNWPVLNSEQMNLGNQKGIKTIDMHTNMMEGLIYLSKASEKAKHLELLKNLFNLIVNKGIHPEYGCTITAFDKNWTPVPDMAGKWTTSYGLNVELAWLLLEAVSLLQYSREDYKEIILGLIDHALENGFDRERGGLAAYGPMKGHVLDANDLKTDRLLKAWWEQAEMLNALIYALEWTGEMKYFDALIKLWDWIWTYQIDHDYGGWYQDVFWDLGKPVTTDKGLEWKTAFHTSRALIQVIQAIKRIMNQRE